MQESNRNTIIALIENGNIKEENINSVLSLLEIIPSSMAWYNFIDKLLLWFGGLALAFAMMFFSAYNWSALTHIEKFAIVEGVMFLTIVAYLYVDTQKLLSKVILMVSSILVGVLLALVGQTYQTGADSWQLFFYWAILILPFVSIGRFSALWIVWIFLLNLSITLYMDTFGRFFGFYLYEESFALWIMFIFNTLAWSIWEFSSHRYYWLKSNWAIRLLGVVSIISITWLVLISIVDSKYIFSIFVWIITLLLLYYIYRVKKIDLFMLSMGAFSFSIVVVNVLIFSISWRHFELLHIFFIGLVVLALGAGFASWLKSLQKELSDERV